MEHCGKRPCEWLYRLRAREHGASQNTGILEAEKVL